MKEVAATVILILITVRLIGQLIPVEPIQVEWKGERYWKYQSVDQHNNTPFKFNYQYDSLGQYLGWVYEFPRDGEWISFFNKDSTKVASIFHVKDSLLNGKSIQYHLNGQEESEFEFYNRQEIGYTRYWNKEGSLISEEQYEYKDYGHFQASIRVGEWKKWDDEGNLIRIINFQDDELHGQQLEFYINGQIKLEEFYISGERDSTLTEYHSNGQVFKQIKYKKGKFLEDNPNYEYHPNGQISGKGLLIQGRKDGTWQYFHQNGALESKGNYETYIYAHDHGDLHFYHKQGIWKYWFPNGQLKAIGTYDGIQIQDIDCGSDLNAGLGIRKEGWKYYNEYGVEITQEEFTGQGLIIRDD